MLMLVSTSSSLAVVENYVVIRDDGAMSSSLDVGDSKRSQINASDLKRLCAVQGLQPAAKAVLLR